MMYCLLLCFVFVCFVLLILFFVFPVGLLICLFVCLLVRSFFVCLFVRSFVFMVFVCFFVFIFVVAARKYDEICCKKSSVACKHSNQQPKILTLIKHPKIKIMRSQNINLETRQTLF